MKMDSVEFYRMLSFTESINGTDLNVLTVACVSVVLC